MYESNKGSKGVRDSDKHKVNKEIKNLKIIYTNADCLTNKKAELNMIIHNMEREPDVIAITEVKPKSSKYTVTASEFNLDGFNLFSNDI